MCSFNGTALFAQFKLGLTEGSYKKVKNGGNNDSIQLPRILNCQVHFMFVKLVSVSQFTSIIKLCAFYVVPSVINEKSKKVLFH